MDLTDSQRAALALIVDFELATMPRAAFDAAAGEATAAELMGLGLIVAWEEGARGKSRADPGVTLCGEPLETPQVTLTPYGAALLRVEIVEWSITRPVWDDAGKPIRPWRAELGEREYPLPYPDRVIDVRPGPAEEAEHMLDPWTGEKIKLFAGGEAGRGIPVVIDRRLARGPKRAG